MGLATTKWSQHRQHSQRIGVGRASRATWIRSVDSRPWSPAIVLPKVTLPTAVEAPALLNSCVHGLSCASWRGCGQLWVWVRRANNISTADFLHSSKRGVAIVPQLVAFDSMEVVAIAGGRSSCQGQLGCDRRKLKRCEHILFYSVAWKTMEKYSTILLSTASFWIIYQGLETLSQPFAAGTCLTCRMNCRYYGDAPPTPRTLSPNLRCCCCLAPCPHHQH